MKKLFFLLLLLTNLALNAQEAKLSLKPEQTQVLLLVRYEYDPADSSGNNTFAVELVEKGIYTYPLLSIPRSELLLSKADQHASFRISLGESYPVKERVYVHFCNAAVKLVTCYDLLKSERVFPPLEPGTGICMELPMDIRHPDPQWFPLFGEGEALELKLLLSSPVDALQMAHPQREVPQPIVAEFQVLSVIKGFDLSKSIRLQLKEKDRQYFLDGKPMICEVRRYRRQKDGLFMAVYELEKVEQNP